MIVHSVKAGHRERGDYCVHQDRNAYSPAGDLAASAVAVAAVGWVTA